MFNDGGRLLIESPEGLYGQWQTLSGENAGITAQTIGEMFTNKKLFYARIRDGTGELEHEKLFSVIPGEPASVTVRFDHDEAVFSHHITVGFGGADRDIRQIRIFKGQQFLLYPDTPLPMLVLTERFQPSLEAALSTIDSRDFSQEYWVYECYIGIPPGHAPNTLQDVAKIYRQPSI